jgi:hypothetical protein
MIDEDQKIKIISYERFKIEPFISGSFYLSIVKVKSININIGP